MNRSRLSFLEQSGCGSPGVLRGKKYIRHPRRLGSLGGGVVHQVTSTTQVLERRPLALQVLECDGACEAAIAGGSIIAYDTGIREVQQRRLRYTEFHGLISHDSFISSCVIAVTHHQKKGSSLSAVVTMSERTHVVLFFTANVKVRGRKTLTKFTVTKFLA